MDRIVFEPERARRTAAALRRAAEAMDGASLTLRTACACLAQKGGGRMEAADALARCARRLALAGEEAQRIATRLLAVTEDFEQCEDGIRSAALSLRTEAASPSRAGEAFPDAPFAGALER